MAVILLALIVMIFAVWTALRTPALQTKLAKKFLDTISEKIGAQISVGRVRYGFQKTIIIRDLFIADENKDTLLHITRLEAKIDQINLSDKKIRLSYLIIKDARSKVYQITDSTFSYSFIMNNLVSNDPQPFSWTISLEDFTLINNSFFYASDSANPVKIDDFNLKIAQIYIDSAHQEATIDKASFNLNGLPFLKNLETTIIKKDDLIYASEIAINLQNSNLLAQNINLSMPLKNSNKKPDFFINLDQARIATSDLALFFPNINRSNDYIDLSGILKGSDSTINGTQLMIAYGEESCLEFEFTLHDIYQPEKLSYDFEVEKLIATRNDIHRILSAFSKNNTIVLPQELDIINQFTYSGSINGDINSLTNKGEINSPLGKIISDVKLTRDKTNQKYWVNGNLIAEPLLLESLLGQNNNGEIAFNIITNGYYSKSTGPQFDITGAINYITFKENTIDSIKIKGVIDNKTFSGRISSFDPKLRFDFDGSLNFDKVPSYKFSLNTYYANLYQLRVTKGDTEANISFVLTADFTGNQIDNSSGNIQLTDVYYFNDTNYFATDSILISSQGNSNGKDVYFKSEYADAHLWGKFTLISLVKSYKLFLNNYLPSLYTNYSPVTNAPQNDFGFIINASYPKPITEMFLPKLKIAPGTQIEGNFNDERKQLVLSGKSDAIEFEDKKMEGINFKAFTKNDKIQLNFSSKEFQLINQVTLKNFLLSSQIYNDSISLNLNWNNWLAKTYSGNLNTLLSIKKSQHYNKPYFKFDIFPSNIVIADTLWVVNQGFVQKDANGISLSNIEFGNGISDFEVDGIYSENPNDSIILKLNKINIAYLNMILKNDNLIFNGEATGLMRVKDIKKQNKIDADFLIQKLSLNHQLLGNTSITMRWNKNEKLLEINGAAEQKGINRFSFNGYIAPDRKELYFDTYFKDQDFQLLEPFLTPTFINTSGKIDGKITLYGPISDPYWKGAIFGKDIKFLVTPTMVDYHFSDSIFFTNRDIVFKNLAAYDRDNNLGYVNGRIWHNRFSDFYFDVKIETAKILGIDLKSKDNPYYHGTIYGSGIVEIKGPSNIIDINIAAKTQNYSIIKIPLAGKGDIKDNDFINFKAPIKETAKTTKKVAEEILLPKAVTNLRIELDITPEVEVQIIFDPQIGDLLRANGVAHLYIESLGPEFGIYGNYTISKGDFMFTLQNVINKKFDIQQGSSIIWTGDPINADIKLDAVYKIRKASVYDLTLDDADKDKRVEVNTHLLMSDKLINPAIKFSVEVPSATHDEAIDQLNSLPAEELNKQVLSLLLINRFTALNAYQTGIATNSGGNLTATTASELLSNQLSNWMSQISNDFDMGFVYRPGDENTQQEYELALSTNLFNDRIVFNGNVGYSENQKNITNNPYTTDFQIEYKVNEKGNIRIRAFQKLNNDITYNQAPYTQGIGIFYTEEFDNFNELLTKMFRRETGTKPKDTEVEEEQNP